MVVCVRVTSVNDLMLLRFRSSYHNLSIRTHVILVRWSADCDKNEGVRHCYQVRREIDRISKAGAETRKSVARAVVSTPQYVGSNCGIPERTAKIVWQQSMATVIYLLADGTDKSQ